MTCTIIDSFNDQPYIVDIEAKTKLLNEYKELGIKINDVDANGETGLSKALMDSNAEKFILLLQCIRHFNTDEFYRLIPIATLLNRYKILDMFLQTQIYYPEMYRKTILTTACLKSYSECVFVILKHTNGLVNHQDDKGIAPIHWAALNGNLIILDMLLEAKADINIKTDKGNTPLRIALKNNKLEVATKLLECGANINIQDNKGKTPIHYICKYNELNKLDLLLKYDVDINIRNKKGRSPDDIAAHKPIYIKLLDYERNKV